MFAHLQRVLYNYLGNIYPFDLFTLVQFSTVQQSLFVLLSWQTVYKYKFITLFLGFKKI